MKNSNKQNYCLFVFVFVPFAFVKHTNINTNKTTSEIYEHMSILDTYKMLPHVTHSKDITHYGIFYRYFVVVITFTKQSVVFV